MESVIVIGAGGHGKVVADIIQKSQDCVAGFLDDDVSLPNVLYGFPVLGPVGQYKRYKQTARFVIAIGEASVREQIAKRLDGVLWYTAIHPNAVISGLGVSIGTGTVIMANAVINAGTSIGRHCIINTGAVVEHDNVIEDFVHVAVGAKLAGMVTVGKSSWIGIGASVSNNLHIGRHCVIGAGAAVVKNMEESGTYVGVPAKRMKMIEEITGGGKTLSG